MRRNGTGVFEKLDKMKVGEETYISLSIDKYSGYLIRLKPKRFRSEPREGGRLVRRTE